MGKSDISPLKLIFSWVEIVFHCLMNGYQDIFVTTLQAPMEFPTYQHRSYRSYCELLALILIRARSFYILNKSFLMRASRVV